MASERNQNSLGMSSERANSLKFPIEFRKDPGNAAENSGCSMEVTVTPPVQMNVEYGGCNEVKVKRFLRNRNGIDYCMLDCSSEGESDYEGAIKVHIIYPVYLSTIDFCAFT